MEHLVPHRYHCMQRPHNTANTVSSGRETLSLHAPNSNVSMEEAAILDSVIVGKAVNNGGRIASLRRPRSRRVSSL
jgi:hypothetical protein